ncbi:anthranilate synthase component I [Amorphus orientalis]|uniref:Anthranilate synthase n=1 Tax=Amorphus orientalis TaxID=649198 RepID=A0AAE3VRE5_9HYPH|nr:anthranilate synthase component I [Amorphus orientalis]MDQ0316967.1 anthranilate synthase [Amorphus orientalis]
MRTTSETTYETEGGVIVRRRAGDVAYGDATASWIARLDGERGAVFSSTYEYPGRYTRWDFALLNPPVAIEAKGYEVTISALNARGRVLLPAFAAAVSGLDFVTVTANDADRIALSVTPGTTRFPEEERSRQPSVFGVVRALIAHFASHEDDKLGLAGAFGYDLVLQFEPIERQIVRPDDQRDLLLYLPDEVLVVDHDGRAATVYSYEFEVAGQSTEGLPRDGEVRPYRAPAAAEATGDHAPGEYAQTVEKAFGPFARGELFEVVPSQLFREPCTASPAAVSRRLTAINPSPYGFFINLGDNEYLVGASPEMFVRVTGKRVETCPISGTIARGRDAIEDEAQIRRLLNSAKDETELTMCSDVDRNDKSRVCEPGSVRMLARRQIELYSRLIHTVDHIEGTLLPERDSLDAFLSHAWAVTVTGAPKPSAMRFIEAHERTPRAWYGGAVGMALFNGDMNTGLTLRTVRIKDGVAEVRAGATVLADSEADAEERETELKASAMIAAIRTAGSNFASAPEPSAPATPRGRRVLLVDHEDSFVHTLANYLRQAGAEVTTLRGPIDADTLSALETELVVLSPGPGRPADFRCAETIAAARGLRLPIFGVCLGLQAIVEAFGGKLAQLDVPYHGKSSDIRLDPDARLFAYLPDHVTVGRYHSLIADPAAMPNGLRVTAQTADGVIMAVEHRDEPIAAVQFHPESIMTLADNVGLRIVANAMQL